MIKDYRGKPVNPGDILLDGRGELWVTLPTSRSISHWGVASVKPYMKEGIQTYCRAYHTFIISPDMAALYPTSKLRRKLFDNLVMGLQKIGTNASVLKARRRKFDEILVGRGIRK